MSSLKKSFIAGFIWSFAGQAGYLLVGLLTNIILARLLTPYEFGQVGIVMFFIIISKVLTESGLTGALVRKKDITEDDFSTVFIFNLGISIFLFLLLLLFSGVIADFYDDQALQNILVALSFILIINAFQFTQNAKIVRELKFKKQSLYALISVIISSVIGIILGFLNYGVWALVIMQICNAFILTLVYWLFEGPVKSFVFNKDSFKSLYKFGVNTTLASLLISLFDNIYNLILGKYFSVQQTGLFYQAKRLQEIPVGVIKSSTLGVVYSTLAKLQDNREEFKKFYDRIVAIFTTLVGLICLLIYFYAEQAILLLYGEQWLGAVFYMQILIIASFFFMQEMLNRVLFKVFDRTDKILYLEILKKIIQSCTIIIGVVFMDLQILLYGFLLTSVISYFINYYHSRKIYESFSWKEVIMVIKVVVVAVFVVVVFNNLNNYVMHLKGYYLFYLFPAIITIYVIILKALNVIDIIKEIRNLFLQILKKS